ncbi:MAG: sigma-70 family RNA polymerase sigma factor [Actinobacteria bacterium]|nr:sigma-70 family RNA polymerase sigma factor [Actinomycetota bacterium]
MFEADYSRLCRLAYLLTGDGTRAEEIVMEAFVRSLAKWRTVREPSAYVRRTVVRLSSNRRRRAFLERRQSFTREPVTKPGEPVDHVLAAVRALPPRQRAAVVLRYWEDMSEADIASALGCAPGTVKSQLAKARVALEAALTNEEDR